MAIYQAVEAIYRCFDSLLTYFAGQKDAAAQGYGKKIVQLDFVYTTYMLMDVLPIITKLCLLFQKKDLDLPIIQVTVRHCLNDLQELKDNPESFRGQDTVTKQLTRDHISKNDQGKTVFKENHILQGRNNSETIRKSFITELIANLEKRFPDSDLISAFGVLGMRPIGLLSQSDLEKWGNDKLEVLLNWFGQKQQAPPKANGGNTVQTDAIINQEATKDEWLKCKELVVAEGYPRDVLAVLWGLIKKFHPDSFPNLLKLAAIALVTPTHTSDCERAFSQQNLIKTSHRNRLSESVLDDLLVVQLEGPNPEEVDFSEFIREWRGVKERRA